MQHLERNELGEGDAKSGDIRVVGVIGGHKSCLAKLVRRQAEREGQVLQAACRTGIEELGDRVERSERLEPGQLKREGAIVIEGIA